MAIIVADIDDKEGYKTVELIQNEAKSSANEPKAVFVHCDVTKSDDLKQAIATCT